MRFLLDEMLPPSCADQLVELGHDTIAVASTIPGATDDEVFDLGVAEGRVVVTENVADFAKIVERRQRGDLPAVPVVLVRKLELPSRGALGPRLAKHLDRWATSNPDPYVGLHWP